MGARRKILIGVLGAVVALLAINTLIVEGETKSAEVTVPGGQVLELPEGEVQYAEYGPPEGSPIATTSETTARTATAAAVVAARRGGLLAHTRLLRQAAGRNRRGHRRPAR